LVTFRAAGDKVYQKSEGTLRLSNEEESRNEKKSIRERNVVGEYHMRPLSDILTKGERFRREKLISLLDRAVAESAFAEL